MDKPKEMRLAVLVDADNIPRRSLKPVLEEIAIYGIPTIKRIYGDFSKQELAGWKPELLENGIIPVQHFGYTTGKNSTDSAMIIDAMDILYGGSVEGFCIVSSDSDFTRLALRIRESGLRVLGFGERKTPQPFIVACDKFTSIEVLMNSVENNVTPAPQKRKQQKQFDRPPLPPQATKLIIDTISNIGDEDGWVFLGELGNLLLKKQPDFDPRSFGFRTLTPLVKTMPELEVDERDTSNPAIRHIFVRESRR